MVGTIAFTIALKLPFHNLTVDQKNTWGRPGGSGG